jgi:hypothetical protein
MPLSFKARRKCGKIAGEIAGRDKNGREKLEG